MRGGRKGGGGLKLILLDRNLALNSDAAQNYKYVFDSHQWNITVKWVHDLMEGSSWVISLLVMTLILQFNTRVVRRQRSSPERADRIRKQSLNIKD